MFLTDRDILKALKKKELTIEPFDPAMVGPGSVDFRLGNVFRIFKGDSEIDTLRKDDILKMSELINVPDGGSFVIAPRELVLATTKEKVGIPDNMLAFIEGKSSYARIGLSMHVTASLIQPGSYGLQTLEIYNLSNHPVRVHPGSPVCQIIFARTQSKALTPYSKRKDAKYYNQKGPDSFKK